MNAQPSPAESPQWVDICGFVVGLSRQLNGLTIASDRLNARVFQQPASAFPPVA